MSHKSRVTMSAIAVEAGVSQSTVSLVLNNSRSIKLAEDTRRRVLETAERLGYRHKQVVHQQNRAERKIAFVFNGLTIYDPFIDAVNACHEAAWQADRLLVTFDYRDDAELVARVEQEINQGEYLGVILASSMTRVVPKLRINPKLPQVLLNCYSDAEPTIPAILPADKLGAYKMVSHLLAQGCRRIALILGEPWMEANTLRLEGYRQALINHDLIPDEQLVRVGNWSLHEAYAQTEALLALPQPPDAIFCCSDYMAQGAYQAVLAANLKIPNDILIAGHDNQMLATEMLPPLTSIELPYDEMGKLAVETLLLVAEGGAPLAPQMKLEGELWLRTSTQRD